MGDKKITTKEIKINDLANVYGGEVVCYEIGNKSIKITSNGDGVNNLIYKKVNSILESYASKYLHIGVNSRAANIAKLNDVTSSVPVYVKNEHGSTVGEKKLSECNAYGKYKFNVNEERGWKLTGIDFWPE